MQTLFCCAKNTMLHTGKIHSCSDICKCELHSVAKACCCLFFLMFFFYSDVYMLELCAEGATVL